MLDTGLVLGVLVIRSVCEDDTSNLGGNSNIRLIQGAKVITLSILACSLTLAMNLHSSESMNSSSHTKGIGHVGQGQAAIGFQQLKYLYLFSVKLFQRISRIFVMFFQLTT